MIQGKIVGVAPTKMMHTIGKKYPRRFGGKIKRTG